MTMQEILNALVTIQQDLKKIDLSKDKDVSKMEEAADKAIKGIDKVSVDQGFTEEHLNATIDMLRNANAEVEKYDPNKEKAKIVGNMSKRDEILKNVRVKEAVAKKVKGKYDEFNKKKAVIEKYKEKFNPDDLTKREQDRYDVNEKRMKANEDRRREVIDFTDKVNGELTEINENLAVVNELSKLKEQSKKLEDLKTELATEEAKADADSGLIDIYKQSIKKQETQLNDSYKKITDKYKTVSLDPKNLEVSITNAQNTARSNIATARTKIDGTLSNAEKKYNYTAGFETFLQDRINAARTDKEYVEVFNEAKRDLEADNIDLRFENDKISENIETISRGKEALKAGTPTRGTGRIPEPTEEEIQDVIKSDSEIRALAPVLTDKEMKQRVYESLTEDKKGKFHPILFLKSRGKKAQEEWKKSYEKEMREKAIEKIKNEKRENSRAAREVDSKRQKFMDSLFAHVMNADSKSVTKMDEDIEKGKPGDTLTKVYDDMEK